ncbi:MAG: hypothetical protein RLZZ577_1702, partial [Bacteroidota bacterium]
TQWLGTDLDYAKIQNMLLGEAFDNLQQGKYALSTVDEGFELTDLQSGKTMKSFILDKEKYSVLSQAIAQPEQDRMINVSYKDYALFKEGSVPMQTLIETFQSKGKTEISFNYTTLTFNEELSLSKFAKTFYHAKISPKSTFYLYFFNALESRRPTRKVRTTKSSNSAGN